MIELRDLFRVYSTPEGDAAALQGLSLDVRAGEIVAILGPSGAGKSSLLRILAGLDTPSAGTARVCGIDLGRATRRARAAYRTHAVGYADQHYQRSLSPELSARELVALPLGLRGASRRERLARADELLDCVSLADRRQQRPAELSGGEQQRVAVCAALAHRPRLLLADEPTGELDRRNAHLVYDAIGRLARTERCTCVLVSHDPESATVADRVVQIRDGRVSHESAREAGFAQEVVVGKGGWLQLPEELLRRAGVANRLTATLDGDRLVLRAPHGSAAPASPLPVPGQVTEYEGVAVSLRKVTKSFGARRIFDELDGEFERGRLHAVTGPSGSGKTTLLHLIAGLELPDAGQVLVEDEDVAALDRAARARLRAAKIGYVGQVSGLIGHLSALENVELALALRGTRADAHETLASVGLRERAGQRVSRLSTGERGRVALARALAARPPVLLADEPTSRLDEANAHAAAALLAELAHGHGVAIVCATHDAAVIERADRELALAYASSSKTSGNRPAASPL
jgi:ABC-type lipoprotein export system ATPase subunit